MAVEVRINGGREIVPGYERILVDGYSVTEDSTPIDPTDTTGGTGQFSFGLDETPSSRSLLKSTADLEDGSQGITQGRIRGLSSSDGVLSVTADSRMNLLMAQKQAVPMNSTLGNVFIYYLSLCGITSNYVIDTTIANIPVVVPGWNAVVWDQIKKLCIAYGVETSLVSNNIVLRPTRLRTAENYRDSAASWSYDVGESAKTVNINYYQSTFKTNVLAYPEGGWSTDVQIYQVDAGETLEVDIPLTTSLVSVVQPGPVLNVGRGDNSASVYAVAGNDGLPIPPAQWTNGGGSLTVAIGDDSKTLKLTIIGASETRYAPYRIAMSAGPSDYYSSLRIIGTGVFTNKQTYVVNTGADPNDTAQDIGAEVENEFINTLDQAQLLGTWATDHWGRPSDVINVSTQGINRLGDSGGYAYKTVNDADAENLGKTVNQFDAIYSVGTVDAFDQYWKDKTKNDFNNQAFGNIAGARVQRNYSWYRIRSSTITESGVTYTAQRDTIVNDVDPLWTGKTVNQFDAIWAANGYSVDRYDLEVLRTS